MKKIFLLLILLLILMPRPARAESGRELVENSLIFDGKRVTYQGEVIGVMARGDYAWINVFDGGFVVGIWSRATDAGKISFIGDYNHIGDSVSVVGNFHMACAEHGGDLDIHADSFAIIASGKRIERMLDLLLTAVSVAFAAIAIFIGVWLRRARKEREKPHYIFEG